jgi:hypothetical protein
VSCGLVLTSAVLLSGSVGCSLGGSLGFFGSPFRTPGPNTGEVPDNGTPGNTGNLGGGGGFGGDDRTAVDPCTEPDRRKFVRITMRNVSPDDTIHYFLLLVAQVNSEEFPNGAVCEDDIDLYTSFGYVEIPAGDSTSFGDFCFFGPSLIYFHEAGQFQNAGGSGGTELASAIGPAQGSGATFDNFFSSAGAQVPIPNQIIFHNPGTGEGAALKISRNNPTPCDILSTGGEAPCRQDAFYYVGDTDIMVGSTALGTGSGRRVPNEIQGTGCECLGVSQPWYELAPSRVTANGARCNEFLRGGRIEIAFLREDTNPPFPQAVWRVTDASGSVVHDFDPRANIP